MPKPKTSQEPKIYHQGNWYYLISLIPLSGKIWEIQIRAKVVSTTIVILLWLLGCAGPTSPTSVEHTEIIIEEFSIAHEVLSRVSNSDKVKWTHFQWESYDGRVPCAGGLANGCLVGGGDLIRWNTNTPGVIQHEAAHGILDKINHPCWRWVSVDGGKATLHYHDYNEDGLADDNPKCREWIEKWLQ